jgi:hypothetical protein
VTRKETLVRLIGAAGMLWFAQGAVYPLAPISHRFYMTYTRFMRVGRENDSTGILASLQTDSGSSWDLEIA